MPSLIAIAIGMQVISFGMVFFMFGGKRALILGSVFPLLWLVALDLSSMHMNGAQHMLWVMPVLVIAIGLIKYSSGRRRRY